MHSPMSHILGLEPPFRAEHVGSLKRPATLLAKRKEFAETKCTQEELIAAEDAAIAEVVEKQRKVGIRGLTDGEFRRQLFYDGLFDQLEGMEFVPKFPVANFQSYFQIATALRDKGITEWNTFFCTSKLRRTHDLYSAQFERLKKHAKLEETQNLKLCVSGITHLHMAHGSRAYREGVYANDEEYFGDLVAIFISELHSLYSAGCRSVQFDEPFLTFFCAQGMRERMLAAGFDLNEQLDMYIRAYQKIVRGSPKGMKFAVHLCRGNYNGTWFMEGGYDLIAKKLFTEMPFDTYYLEYDTDRAGTFEPLKYLPLGKAVVLGLVSTKTPIMEDPVKLEQSILEAAAVIANGEVKRSKEYALNQLCLSPQCGFASHADGNPISEEDVWRKLQLVVDVAKRVWA
ncbi:UROD/MetE-like protein [Ramaria rubella]|nr:UROD/MetE-like protein [Ramaria rubella]